MVAQNVIVDIIEAVDKKFVVLDHTKSVECVAFSSDSRLLCSGSWDKSAVLWNTEVLTFRDSFITGWTKTIHIFHHTVSMQQF